jgi:cytochrome P450
VTRAADADMFSLESSTFTDPAIQERPNRFYRALRERDPVHFDEKLGMYLVSRHEDLDAVFRDPVTYSQEKGYYSQMAYGYLDELKAILERDGGGFFPDVVNVDPPRHARARLLTQQAFTARRMKALEPEFEALVDRLIDGFIDQGAMDGLHDLALPMAIGFAKNQLKVPELDQDTIRRWGAAYLAQFSLLESREQMVAAAKDLCELQNYLIALVKRRIEEPGEDMLSDLIRARTEGENPQLSFAELVATARAILINTHDSVSTALINILFKVATEPAIAAEFYGSADDDKRMARVVEELLRLEPPVRAMSRMTTRPVELGGKQLPEGAHLLLLFASGNDDDAVFDHARRFDIARPNLVRSMTFGAGVHLCLGISLARMQLRVAASKAAQRLKNLRLAIPVEDIRYVPNVALLTMQRLPLTFACG